jgi:peptidase M15-like protein
MRFEDKVRVLAALYPISVTSWIRSRKHNTAVGGVPTSRHLLGLAVDVVIDPGADSTDFTLLASQLGLEVIPEGDHFHLQEPRSKA